jgi:hypothetical protein
MLAQLAGPADCDLTSTAKYAEERGRVGNWTILGTARSLAASVEQRHQPAHCLRISIALEPQPTAAHQLDLDAKRRCDRNLYSRSRIHDPHRREVRLRFQSLIPTEQHPNGNAVAPGCLRDRTTGLQRLIDDPTFVLLAEPAASCRSSSKHRPCCPVAPCQNSVLGRHRAMPVHQAAGTEPVLLAGRG